MRQFKLLCVSKAEFSEFSIHVFIDLNSFDVTCNGYLGFTAVGETSPQLPSKNKSYRVFSILKFYKQQKTKNINAPPLQELRLLVYRFTLSNLD